MKTFFKKISELIKNNYWLQPLLLVALVFALVFGISQFSSLATFFEKLFDTEEYPTTCEEVTYTEAVTKWDATDNDTADTADDSYILLIGSTDCAACQTFYPILNDYLAINDQFKVDYINVAEDTDYVGEYFFLDVFQWFPIESTYNKNITYYEDKTLNSDSYDVLESDVTSYGSTDYFNNSFTALEVPSLLVIEDGEISRIWIVTNISSESEAFNQVGTFLKDLN